MSEYPDTVAKLGNPDTSEIPDFLPFTGRRECGCDYGETIEAEIKLCDEHWDAMIEAMKHSD